MEELRQTKANDAVFKDNYKVYAFAKHSYLEPEWELQVQHIRQLWNTVGNLIDRMDRFCLQAYSFFMGVMIEIIDLVTFDYLE